MTVVGLILLSFSLGFATCALFSAERIAAKDAELRRRDRDS